MSRWSDVEAFDAGLWAGSDPKYVAFSQNSDRWRAYADKCRRDFEPGVTERIIRIGRAVLDRDETIRALTAERDEAREVGFRQHKQIDGLLVLHREAEDALEARVRELTEALRTLVHYLNVMPDADLVLADEVKLAWKEARALAAAEPGTPDLRREGK